MTKPLRRCAYYLLRIAGRYRKHPRPCNNMVKAGCQFCTVHQRIVGKWEASHVDG